MNFLGVIGSGWITLTSYTLEITLTLMSQLKTLIFLSFHKNVKLGGFKKALTGVFCRTPQAPEKLEKAGTVIFFKEHPARKVGTRSRQCRPKVPLRHLYLEQRQILRTGHVPEKIVAKDVRGAFPTSPRKFARKMYGGIQKCAEIV